MNDTKIQHAQTLLTLEELEKLKEVTNESTTKEALSKAVTFTLKNMGKKKKLEKEECN